MRRAVSPRGKADPHLPPARAVAFSGDVCARCDRPLKKGAPAHHVLTDIHGNTYRDEVAIPAGYSLDWLTYGTGCARTLVLLDRYTTPKGGTV